MKSFKKVIEKNQASIENGDLAVLLPLVAEVEPKIILEIGAWRGYSAQTWKRAFGSEVITIENEKGALDFITKRIANEEFEDTQGITLISKDSHSEEAFKMVDLLLQGKRVDFLFIDGDHSYEGVKKDFEMYSPLVKQGGIIAFHDALYHADKTEEVDVFWNEIKKEYPHNVEIKASGNSTGIGVIWK